MATPLATAFVRVRPDLRSFKQDTDAGIKKSGVDKSAEQHGRRFGSVFSKAAAVGLAGVGFVAVAQRFIAAATDSNKVTAQTAAVIKSTGGAAKVTSGQVQDLADVIMKKTGIDNSAIRSGENMLLTFTNIKNAAGKNNDIFNQASSVLVDMTAAMNGGNVSSENLRKQAIQLGKALNDPVKGLTALQRVGVQFTAQQKTQIATLVKSGNTLGAQKIILRELTREFGGSAAAAATPAKKLSASITELQVSFGKLLIPVLNRVIPPITRLANWFSGLSPTAQKTVVALGAVAVGIGLLGKAITLFGNLSKLAALGNPWILLAATIALVVTLIITHWKTIKAWTVRIWHDILSIVSGVWQWIKAHWPLLLTILAGPIGLAAAFIIKHWTIIRLAFADAVKFIRSSWDTLIQRLRDLVAWFVGKFLGFVQTIINAAAKAFGWIPGIGPKLRTASAQFDQFRKNVTGSIAGIKGKTVTVGVVMSAATNPYGKNSLTGRAATGGLIRGPGGPRDDRAGLYALSDREYVMPADVVEHYGVRFMEAIRAKGLAAGGLVVNARTPSRAQIDRVTMADLMKVAGSFVPSFPIGAGGFGSGVTRWAGLVLQVLGMIGQSRSWLGVVLRRMNQESGGNPFAINLWDSNAAAGDPSRGLMQTIGSTFNTYAGPFRSRGIYDPLANVYAALEYTLSRYGTLGALSRPGGYADGGPITEPIVGVGRSGKTYTFGEAGSEYVSSNADMKSLIAAVEYQTEVLHDAIGDNATSSGRSFAQYLNGLGLAGTRSRAYGAR